MIESKDARLAREKAEIADREARIKAYEAKMGVQLPYSPVSVLERPIAKVNVKPESARIESNVNVNVKPAFDRKGYMRDYMKKARAKEKTCRHCGKANP